MYSAFKLVAASKSMGSYESPCSNENWKCKRKQVITDLSACIFGLFLTINIVCRFLENWTPTEYSQNDTRQNQYSSTIR